jgi:phosphoserine phosphatase RsbU/P
MTTEEYQIQIRRPGAEPERVQLDPVSPCTLGRSPTNRVVIGDVSISRHHAEIFFKDGDYWIQDLGSKNGTKVGAKRIDAATQLKPGDRLQLGSVQLVFGRSGDGALFEESGGSARVADVEAPVHVKALAVDDISSSGALDTKSIAGGIAPERIPDFVQAMDRFSQALLAYRPLEELFQFVVELTAEVLRADRTTILLRTAGGELLPKAVARTGSRPGTEEEIIVSRTIARMAVDRRQAILTHDAQADTRFREQQSVIQQRIHAAMCAPLWHEGDVLGLLYVDNVAAPAPFDEIHLRLLTFIAHLAAVKIRETEIQDEKMRRDEELRRAAGLQQALLPQEPRIFGTLEIAGRNIPSLDVGGDYFDFVQGEGARLVVGLGDVAGKGMPAALLMTHLAASVRAQVETERPLLDVIRRLNRSIHQNVAGTRFITLFLAEVNTETGAVTYVNGGHNPPYLLRASGPIETLTEGGLLLGIMPEAAYASGSLTLEPGDVLVLYSDGVTEAFNQTDEEFGEQRLLKFLQEAQDGRPEEIVDGLIREVRDFSRRPKPSDDVTVVVMRRV